MDTIKQIKKDSIQRKAVILLCVVILAAGFAVKLLYAGKVAFDYSPHDVGHPQEWDSVVPGDHLGYIQYIYKNRSVPDISPLELKGQLYHPPLFHAAAALVLDIYDPIINDNLTEAFEGVQMMNMAVAALIPVVSYFTLKKISITGFGLVASTAAVSFFPPFIWMGAAINNDIFMTFFASLTVYFAVCWAQNQKMGTIIAMAVCLALSMLSKTSGVLLAPALALLFLIKAFGKKGYFKKLLPQFIVFGLISVPLGLSWVLYQNIRFGVPLNYVLHQPEGSFQDIRNSTLSQRLGFPDILQLKSYSIMWDYASHYSNIWGQTLFTMCLDEGILQVVSWNRYYWIMAMYWTDSIVAILMTVCLFIFAFIKKAAPAIRIFLVSAWLALMGSYILFCFSEPFVCTANFRYIGITIIVSAAGYGICRTYAQKKIHKVSLNILGGLMIIAGILTSVVYLECATKW